MIPQRYRTTPPPKGATPAQLLAWAVEEGRHYPGQPQFYSTWWLRQIKKKPSARQMELF